MRFNFKFENKEGMKTYEQEFINSKVKYIYNKKRRFEVRFSETKTFGFKKYGNAYNAKFKALEYLEQLKEELKVAEEKKQQQKKQYKQPTHCKCGDPFGPLKRCFFCGDYIF